VALVNPGDTHTSPLWEGDDAGDLFGAAVPNPDPLDTDSNGTINANGVNTRSLRFDAFPNYVRRDDDDVLDITGSFTIEGYFRVDEPSASQSEIFVYKRNNAMQGLGYQMWMDIFGRVHVMADNGPTTGRVAWDDTRLDDGLWHHFAGIRDDNNDLHIWIDGVEDLTPATNGVTNVSGDLNNNETFRVGSNGLGGMTGYLDEIRLSNVALTPSQFLNASVSLDGDYDDSGLVAIGDLNLVLFNWNAYGGTLPSAWVNQRPETGSVVGTNELNGVLFNWNNMASIAAVPEPVSGMLAVFGLLALGISCGRGR